MHAASNDTRGDKVAEMIGQKPLIAILLLNLVGEFHTTLH